MAADNTLQIKILVDGSQLSAGMARAASTVEAASAQMASGLQPVMRVSQQTFDNIEGGTLRAREGIALLGEDFGIKIPRAIRGTIAQTELLGAAFSAVFPVFAFITGVEIIERFPDAIKKATESFMGWNEESKRAYENQLKLNGVMLDHLKELELEKISNDESGLKGTERTKKELSDADLKIAKLKEYLLEQGNIALQAERELAAVTVIPAHLTGRVMIQKQEIRVIEEGSDAWKERKKKIEEATTAQEKYHNEILKLQEVEKPRKVLTLGTEEKSDAEKASKLRIAAGNAEVEQAERNEKAIASLIKERDKAQTELKQLTAEGTAFFAKENEKQTADELKAIGERSDAERKFQSDRLKDEEEADVAAITALERVVQEQLRLGKISNEQARVQLNKLASDKLAIELKYITDRQSVILARLNSDDAKTYAEDLAAWSKLLHDKQQAQITANAAILANNNKAATADAKLWNSAFATVNRTIETAIHGMVTGTQTFRSAFVTMIDDITTKFIQAMERQAMEYVATNVLMLTVKKSIHQQEVLADAKSAAAAAWKAVAGIPVIGPILAPIAAATAFAGVEAFSAAGGWLVPGSIPGAGALTMVHPNERILPASYSSGLDKMVGNAAGFGGGSSAGGGDVHFTYSPTINTIDARGMREALQGHGDTIVKLIRQQQREFKA